MFHTIDRNHHGNEIVDTCQTVEDAYAFAQAFVDVALGTLYVVNSDYRVVDAHGAIVRQYRQLHPDDHGL